MLGELLAGAAQQFAAIDIGHSETDTGRRAGDQDTEAGKRSGGIARTRPLATASQLSLSMDHIADPRNQVRPIPSGGQFRVMTESNTKPKKGLTAKKHWGWGVPSQDRSETTPGRWAEYSPLSA
ncbi:hypothetical protein N1Z41_00035905 [Pseudomonas aeruginosa]